MRHVNRSMLVAGAATAGLLLSGPAQAADPPDSWTNERLLNCDGTMVETYLNPAGFGTPFHVLGSTDVIIPVHVEVIFPGETEPVTTFHVPGYDRNERETVHCTYVDPAGLYVDLLGTRV